jgi:penicillin-binding protein 1A
MAVAPTAISIIHDRYGHYIQTVFCGPSKNTRNDEFPLHFYEHIKRVEDREFDTHWGINIRGIIRAIWVNFRKFSIHQGGSSITQQFIRGHIAIRLRLIRKCIEFILAPLITIFIGRRRILAGYVKTVYWGRDIRGGLAAAQLYLGKNLKRISSVESLVLSSMLSRPNYWMKHPNHLAKKTLAIIKRDSLQITERNVFKIAKCIAKRSAKTIKDEVPSQYFGSLRKLRERTTLNLKLNRSLSLNMKRQQMNDCFAVIIDSRKWEVLAICNTDKHSQLYPVLNSKYLRLGSLLKPFLLIAFHRAGIDPATFFLKSQELQVEYPKNKIWLVRNYKNNYRGMLSLADAIVYSDNTACVQALLHIGLDSFKKVLIDYGIIDHNQKITPSIILGSSIEGIQLIRLLKAYAIISSGKSLDGDPFVLGKRFESLNGEKIKEIAAVRRVLKNVIAFGTAKELTRVGALGGKTGSERNVTNLIYYDVRGRLYFFSQKTRDISNWAVMKGINLASKVRKVRKSITRELGSVLKASFKGRDIYGSTKRAA